MNLIKPAILLFVFLAPLSASLDWRSDGGDFNPEADAAAHCIEHGYIYKGEIAPGLCIFPDGSSCLAWDFYGGQCGYNREPVQNAPTEYPETPLGADFMIIRGKLISDSAGSVQGSDNYFDMRIDIVLENSYPFDPASGEVVRVHSQSYALISDLVRGRCVEVRVQLKDTDFWIVNGDVKEISCSSESAPTPPAPAPAPTPPQPTPYPPQPPGPIGCNEAECQAHSQPVGEQYIKNDAIYQRFKKCNCLDEECQCEVIEEEIPGPYPPTPECEQAECQAGNGPIGESYVKNDKVYQRYKECNCRDNECQCEVIEKEGPSIECQEGETKSEAMGEPYVKDGKLFQRYRECSCVDYKWDCKTVDNQEIEIKFRGKVLERNDPQPGVFDVSPIWRIKIEYILENKYGANIKVGDEIQLSIDVLCSLAGKELGYYSPSENPGKDDKVEVYGIISQKESTDSTLQSHVDICGSKYYYFKLLTPGIPSECETIGGMRVSELEEKFDIRDGHECYSNANFDLLILYCAPQKEYPEVSKVKLILYDKNNCEFSNNQELAFKMYIDFYFGKHRKEIIDKMDAVIYGEGLVKATNELEEWMLERSKMPDPLEEFIKSAGLEGLSQILAKVGSEPLGYLSTIFDVIDIFNLINTVDHTSSDFISVEETENNRINKLLENIEKYDNNPFENNYKDEILKIENWKIGIYKDYYLADITQRRWDLKETLGLTWDEVFTYRNIDEGWFATSGPLIDKSPYIDIFYASCARDIWIKNAYKFDHSHTLNSNKFFDNPTQQAYRDAWMDLIKWCDSIRIASIFRSMIDTQEIFILGPLSLEDQPLKLPYPYSPDWYDTNLRYIIGKSYKVTSWEDYLSSRPDADAKMKDSLDSCIKADYWKETAYGIIEKYMLFSNELVKNIDLIDLESGFRDTSNSA